MLEHAPELLLLPLVGGIATFILFSICLGHREIRGRVMPLCVLTLLHTLSFLLVMIFFTLESGWTEIVGNILGWFYLFGIPVFLLFICIYSVALGTMDRMTRHIGLAAAVFAGNVILQPLLVILTFSLHPGLLE